MIRPPQFVELAAPGTPDWRTWWGALVVLWGLQSGALVTLWPEHQPRAQLWLWSAATPLCWGLALALRMLPWQLRLYEMAVHRRVQAAASARWWAQRSLALPVEKVLLLGPAGGVQEDYQQLMSNVAPPVSASAGSALRCPLVLSGDPSRSHALAAQLARELLTLPDLPLRWPSLRALCWVGDEHAEAGFSHTCAQHGLVLPEARIALNDTADLDELIDAFSQHAEGEDWLLCAGALSLDPSQGTTPAGEGAFLWLVSHQPKAWLHRGEGLAPEDDPLTLCTQVQRYAGISSPPAQCLAMDDASAQTLALAQWPSLDRSMMPKWGSLAQLAPFMAMSLALVNSSESRHPCGWAGRDAQGAMAAGVVMPNGNE